MSKEAVCSSAARTSLSGLNNGINAGRICWAVAGSFSGNTVAGTSASKKSSCINCDFFKLVAEQEGSNFKFLTPKQLLTHDTYIYGKRKSTRFAIHFDLEVMPSQDMTGYLVSVMSNYSRDGFSFVSEYFEPASDEPMKFRIIHPCKNRPIEVIGSIVWQQQVRDRSLAGCQIREMEHKSKMDILNYAYDNYIKGIKIS